MRILYLDIDTTRPDHLGCYGYHRNTSPNIDRIAAEGIRFDNCYVSDAPCLPSRSALFNGRFGIHTGVVGHGGTAADLRLEGSPRAFANSRDLWPWVMALAQHGLHTVSVSPFAERHAAWWFCNGFREMYNTGKRGSERADEVAPLALDWIERNAKRDNWLLHVNLWDPHTPYRTPESYGNPFEGEPGPDWLTEELLQKHRASYGSHSAREPRGYRPLSSQRPREVSEIASLDDFRRTIDGYDVGIRYADDHCGMILDALAAQGVLDDTIVIISSDHGENQGELNVYGDHQTADHITNRVPLILRWPGLSGGRVDSALHYQMDMAATMLELLGAQVPALWDGQSFAGALRQEREEGRDYLVVSQCAWSCQRAVRQGPWIMIRTYHAGYKDYPPIMLFHVEQDPHETRNLAGEQPEVVNHCLALLETWHGEMMSTSQDDRDPLWTVIREGGPFHTRGSLAEYCDWLRRSQRAHHAETLIKLHPNEL